MGYLAGYDSTNIYRIWIPSERRIVRTRDVIFDETEFYDPDKTDLSDQLRVRAEQILEVIRVDQSGPLMPQETHSDTDTDTDEDGRSDSEQDEQGHQEIEVPTDIDEAEQDGLPIGLPTPEETPEPQQKTPEPQQPQTSRTIVGDVIDAHIVEGPRARRASSKARKQAHFADLERLDELPGYYAAFATGLQCGRLHRDQLPPLPRTWQEMLKHPHKDGFLAAADKEYKDLERRGTFKVVKKTQATKTLPVMWVFDYKFDMNGYLAKQKARLCVRGDLQPWTNQDTYAATLAARTFRALMAVTAAFDLEARQLDAVNAFTNSQLDETVYIEFPDGYQMPGYCILLQRALYGLRRSPLLWFKEFSSTLVELKLVMVKEDVCVFTNGWMLVFFFVDDITILCKTADLPRLESFVQNLMQRYELRDLGELSWFLGIRILRDRPRRRLWLCQDSYIEKIVSKFHLDDVKPATTPMVTEELIPYEGQATPGEIYAYQQKVGSLQYAATISRPDTARAASRLAEFLTNPSPYHQGAVNRALTYLNGTKTLAIEYSAAAVADGQQAFLCASDAAFADDTPTRRSSERALDEAEDSHHIEHRGRAIIPVPCSQRDTMVETAFSLYTTRSRSYGHYRLRQSADNPASYQGNTKAQHQTPTRGYPPPLATPGGPGGKD